MCVQALATAGAFQAAPSNLIGAEARYQITLDQGLSAAPLFSDLGKSRHGKRKGQSKGAERRKEQREERRGEERRGS
jgi:hypothetical protein